MKYASGFRGLLTVGSALHGVPVLARAIMLALPLGLSLTALARANPQGGTVVAGQAQVVQTAPAQVEIRQSTDKAIIDWRSFDIAKGEQTKFVQPSAASITLNRVTGGSRSEIDGRLTANGQVWVVNPSGIVFGRNAQVDVAGLIATTHNIKNDDFMAGRYRFEGSADNAAMVENHGSITAREAGLVGLVAPGVANDGTITARLGEVTLASGRKFVVDFYGDQRINLATDAPVTTRPKDADGKEAPALVTNSGKVFADGGRVRITAHAAKGIVDKVVNMSGVVQAQTVDTQGGDIVLSGSGGAVEVSGTIDAKGTGKGQRGGAITVTGDTITLKNGSRLDASGKAGGGTVLVGGDFQGGHASAENLALFKVTPARKPVPPAEAVTMEAGATIAADALEEGNGGTAVLWSDGVTLFSGAISARGGAAGGGGGLIETSSKGALRFDGRVDVAAPLGTAGNILLDPTTVTIDNAASDINGTNDIISVSSIEAIGSGTVTISATSSITLADLSANSGLGTLTLQPGVSLDLETTDGNISFANTANTITAQGSGNITLNASACSGYVTGCGASNGTLTTIGNITAAAGNILLMGSDGVGVSGTLTTSGGNISIDADADQLGGGGLTLSSAIATGGGNLTLKSGTGGIALNGNTSIGAGTLSFATTAGNTGTYTIGGALSLTGNATFNQPLTLANGASITTNGTIAFTNTADFSANASVTLTANAFSFSNAVDGNGGTLTFKPATTSKDARITGTVLGGEIDLTGALAQLSNFTLVRYVNTGTGAALFGAAFDLSSKTYGLDIDTAAALTTGDITMSSGKALLLQSDGALSVGNLTALNGVTLGGTSLSTSGSITTNGAVVLQPATASQAVTLFGSGGFSVSQSLLDAFGSSPSEITVGRSDGTGLLTVNAGTAATNLKLLSSGSGSSGISIAGALNVGSNRLTLDTRGAVTQAAAITAGSLELRGTGGTYTLTNAANSISTLAGNTGSVNFTNAGSFTVGTVTSTGLTATGDVTLYAKGSAADLTVSNNISVNSASNRTATLRADHGVTVSSANIQATGSGKLAMVLNACYADGTSGNIYLNNATLTSKGGNISLVGGSSAGGYALGDAGVNDGRGILLLTSTLDARKSGSGGNILVKGQGADSAVYGLGIEASTNAVVRTDGTGTITLNGVGGSGSSGFSAGIDIYNHTTIATTTGALSLTGTNAGTGSTDYAISFDHDPGSSSIVTSTSGAISISAANSGKGSIVAVTPTGASKASIGWDGTTTTSGDITITGNLIDLTPDGSSTSQLQIKSTGAVTLQPIATGTSVGVAGGAGSLQLLGATLDALQNGFSGITIGRSDGTAAVTMGTYAFKDPVTLRSLGTGGTVVVTGTVSTNSGTGGGAVTLTAASGVVVSSGGVSADTVVFTADSIDIQSSATVSGTGTLTIQPLNAGTSIGIGGGAGALNLSAAILDRLQNGFTLITIGRSDSTGAVTVGTYSFKDPVVVRSPGSGGTVTVTGTLSTDSASGGGAVTLTGAGGVTVSTGTVNAGSSALTVNADSVDIQSTGALAGTGSLTFNPLSTSTTIGLSGGSGTLNLTAAELARLQDGFSGITIGRSDGTGAIAIGGAVTLADSLTLLSPGAGSGGITLGGAINVGSGNDLTLNTLGTVSQTAAITAGGLRLLGSGVAYTLTNAANSITTLAADTGSLNLISNSSFTVGTVGATSGLTLSGALTLKSSLANGTLTFSQGATAGDDVRLTADRMAINAAIGATGHIVTLAPTTSARAVDLGSATDAAAGTLELSDAELDRLTAGTLRIGDANTGAITVSSAISPANASILRLTTGSGISETAGITIASLLLSGAGTIDLSGASNTVSTLAVDGTSNPTVKFRRDASFALGTVDGVSGANVGTGSLVLTTTGTVTQSQTITAGGLGLLGTGGTFTLANAVNNIATLAADTGSFSYRDADGFTIGTVNPTGITATGNVTLQAGGAVTQSQAITALGLELLGSGVSYTLTNTANHVTTLAADTGSLSYTDGSGFTVGTVNTVGITTSGALALTGAATTAGSTLTVAQAISIGGDTTLSADRMAINAAVGAGANTVTLTPTTSGRAVDLGSATDAAAAALELSDTELDRITAGVLRIGNTSTGQLSITSAISPAGTSTLALATGTGISQTAALTVANLKLGGSGTLDLSAVSNPVSVLAVDGSTGNPTVKFRKDGAFAIGTVDGTAGAGLGTGNLSLTSTGTVTQTQAITAAGLELLGSGAAYTLTNASNHVTTFAGNTGTVSYRDSGSFTIGTVNTAGLTVANTTLTLTAGSAIDQTAALSGVSRLALSAGGAIGLDVTGVTNTITTLGAVSRGGAFSLSDDGGLTLDGAVGSAAADVSIRTTGALTVSANATVAASGSGNVVLAADGGAFTNGRGSDAISLGSGRWIIYGATRDGSNENGLSGTREYTRTYSANAPATVTRSGNVFMYGNTPIITVTAVDASRVYGDANPTFTVTYSGVLSGDETATNYSGVAAFTTASQSANVGTYTLAPSAGTLTSPTGYAFTYVNGSMTITPAPLSVSGDTLSKIYGDSDPALTYAVSGLKLSDSAGSVLSGGLSRSSGENVGTYAIGQGSLAANANYTLSYNDGSLGITKAALTVTADAASKTYGDSDPAFIYGVSGLKFSDSAGSVLSGSLSRSSGENAGTYAIGQGSLAANGNYTFSYTGADLTIAKAALTVTANAATKTYGDSDPAFTYGVSGLKFSDSAGSVLSGSLSRTGSENAGTYAITQGALAANNNYSLVYTGANLTITRKPLTVTADDASRNQGEANPVFTVGYSGFAFADTAGSLSGSLSVSTPAGSDTAAGTYGLTPGGLSSGNYDITFKPGVLTVKPVTAPITPPPTTPNTTTPNVTPATTTAVNQATNTVNAINNTQTTTTTTPPVTSPTNTTTPSSAAPGTTPAALLANLTTGQKAGDTAAIDKALGSGSGVSLTVGGQAVSFSATALSAFAAGASLNSPSPTLLISPNVLAAASRLASAIASGGMAQAVSSMSSMSIAERRAALMNIPVDQLVSGLLTSTDPTARAVGAILQDAVSGAGGGYADVKKAVESGDVAHDDALTYLAMFQHVQRVEKTQNWEGAVDALKGDPTISDVFGPGGAGTGGRSSNIVSLLAPRVNSSGAQVVEGQIADSGNIKEATINGRWVFVDEQGRFEADIPIAAGQNELVLKVTEENGTVTERRITVQASQATPPEAAAPRIGRKIALMIATDNYRDPKIPPLNTPESDVKAVSDALNERLGYETRILKNPTKQDIVKTMRDLGKEVSENDQVMVYYAGHGYEVAETGTGYWLPADAAPDNPRNWISNNDIGRFLNRMPAKQIMVVSDSCYSGAFTREQKIEGNGAVADPARLLERRSVMAMSSGGDEPVADGQTHSPFAASLLNRVKQLPRDSGGYELFTNIRDDVTAEVPQTPQYGVIKAAGYDAGGDYFVGLKGSGAAASN